MNTMLCRACPVVFFRPALLELRSISCQIHRAVAAIVLVFLRTLNL